MSNSNKEHTSIRYRIIDVYIILYLFFIVFSVHAPPGGHSNNIFGTSEFDQSAANKKKHMESDIFGVKKDNNETAPAK